MSKALAAVACVLSILVGFLGTLCWLVLMIASSPNSTPEQLRAIKQLMLGGAAVGLASAVIGTWLGIKGWLWAGAAVGIFPAVAMVVAIVVISMK